MLIGIEEVLQSRPLPDWVLVYGDTNSTLAAALAAVKLGIPLAHVEAGLRSFNRDLPEEHNRIVTDHCSDLLLCPTPLAVEQLEREGLGSRARLVGDVMFDAFLHNGERAKDRLPGLLATHDLRTGGFALATVHRPYNTDDPAVLRGLLEAFGQLDCPVLFPVHPRTRARLDALPGWSPAKCVRLLEPLGYLDLIALAGASRLIMTDSGGLQKEAYFLGVPCLTLRPETEWIETIDAGWNLLVGNEPARIVEHARSFRPPEARPPLYGDGHAAEAIVALLAGSGS
jgi:UDP-N-acetylglucosamine 2-epimerase